MNPVILSLSVGEPPSPSGVSFLAHLQSVSRVRLLPRKPEEMWQWIDLLRGKRISIDINADEARRLPVRFPEINPAIRQIRILINHIDEISDLVDHIRGSACIPPLVFLLPIDSLEVFEERWSIIKRWSSVFINLIPGKEDNRLLNINTLSLCRGELGKRLFLSLPALAAFINDPDAAPCPTRLGLHVYIDADSNVARSCDCGLAQDIPIDGEGLWLDAWRAQVYSLGKKVAIACDGCPIWEQCRGGCISKRSDGTMRDRYCPWPDKSF